MYLCLCPTLQSKLATVVLFRKELEVAQHVQLMAAGALSILAEDTSSGQVLIRPSCAYPYTYEWLTLLKKKSAVNVMV